MQDRPTKAQRLVRKQILITPEQSRRLKALAKSTDKPEAELVRSMLDRGLGIEEGGDWRQRLLALAGTLDAEEADHLAETIRENRTRWNQRLDDTRRRLRGE